MENDSTLEVLLSPGLENDADSKQIAERLATAVFLDKAREMGVPLPTKDVTSESVSVRFASIKSESYPNLLRCLEVLNMQYGTQYGVRISAVIDGRDIPG